jgi:hypothetical protein
VSRELKNEFAWSKSREETFRDCLRKYYFQYYGFWNGWKEDADPRVRQIYVLKNLRTRAMWAGERVHRCIEGVLAHYRAGRQTTPEDPAVQQMLEGMRQDFRDSRSRRYRREPKKTCGLFEHEYEVAVSNEAWKETADRAADCVRNFYRSTAFERIRARPVADWLEIEKRSGFTLDGLRVYVQLDFAFRDGPRIGLYDWKTGRPSPGRNDVQLACYALYATQKWNAAPADVTAIELNLQTLEETPHALTGEQVESVKDHIRESADEMLFPLSDPEHNVAGEDAFDFAEDDGVCRRCNFLKVCPKWR